MTITRRQVLHAGAALGATVLLPPALAQAPNALLTRPVPATGARLPLVGIGTNRFRTGDAAWIARLRETLTSFARLGGKVVDTAPAYGDSEQLIGSLLAESGVAGAGGLRPQLFLATKVGRDSAADGRQSLAESFAALRSPRLDLVQLHSLRGVATVLPVLREQQAAGHIAHIGITSSSDSQYGEMEAIMRREGLDFIQVDYAVGNRGAARGRLPDAAMRQTIARYFDAIVDA